MGPPVSDQYKDEMLLGGLWCREEEEIKKLRITERTEGRGGVHREESGKADQSNFAITKNPTRKGGVWGTREEENSGYGDVFAQVDVLNGVEELHAVGHGALEGFAAADEAGASGALVDYGGGYSVFEIVGAGRAAGIDEAGSAHEAVGDLVAG
jgi:hypothetical protein